LLTVRCTNVLLGLLCLGTLDCIFTRLELEGGTVLAKALLSEGIHSSLKGVTLPAEQVITMSAEAGAILEVSSRVLGYQGIC